MNETEQQVYRSIYVGVSLALDTLDKDELLGVLLCVKLGSSPKGRGWNTKVGHLWDQNGVRMNDLTKEIVMQIASERLGI